MPATTRSSGCSKTVLPTPRCFTCRTIKKERTYALCSECYKHNGTLDRERFAYLARRAERETVQYSYRSHPEFEKACRIYAKRRERARPARGYDSRVPPRVVRETDARDRYQHETCDGLGGHDLNDLLDWQIYGIPLPRPERSEHREWTEADVARWDARLDAWAQARGIRLAEEQAPELQPWVWRWMG